jgi:hypothetical protein
MNVQTDTFLLSAIVFNSNTLFKTLPKSALAGLNLRAPAILKCFHASSILAHAAPEAGRSVHSS